VRLVALVVALAIGVVLVLVAVVPGESGERTARLKVELFPGPTGLELVVYVPARHNTPDVARNRSTVRLVCADAAGDVIVEGAHRWPFRDTDRGTTEPHVHQPVREEDVGAVRRCRLLDTDPALQGPIAAASIR
jgi:hypothetical protein